MRNHIFVAVAGLAVAASAHGDTVVIPNTHANQQGNVSNTSMFNSGERVHQMVIAASELASIPSGSSITGIAWRRGSGTTWPASTQNIADYRIQVSTSLFPPGSLSTTLADNIAGDVVLARSGPLEIPAGALPGGSSPNPFGPTIEFTSPFTYEGGDLLITVRHSGTGSSSGSVDGLSTGSTAAGYGTLFQALGENQLGMWAEEGRPWTFMITQISFEEGDACYANCDGSTSEPILTVDDFTCFINEYAAAQSLPPQQQIEHYANCDGSTTEPVLTVDDFTCFINAFAQGCP